MVLTHATQVESARRAAKRVVRHVRMDRPAPSGEASTLLAALGGDLINKPPPDLLRDDLLPIQKKPVPIFSRRRPTVELVHCNWHANIHTALTIPTPQCRRDQSET